MTGNLDTKPMVAVQMPGCEMPFLPILLLILILILIVSGSWEAERAGAGSRSGAGDELA
jgi:hypothetical protein